VKAPGPGWEGRGKEMGRRRERKWRRRENGREIWKEETV